jgi:hypothetical protein
MLNIDRQKLNMISKNYNTELFSEISLNFGMRVRIWIKNRVHNSELRIQIRNDLV